MADNKLTRGRYLGTIYSNFKKRCVDVNVRILVPWARVYTSFYTGEDSCYCRPTKSTGWSCKVKSKKAYGYRIVFGGKFLAERIVGIPDSKIDMKAAKDFFSDSVKGFKGIYYHEAAHLRYTDMESVAIISYPVEEEKHALHQLFNIFEDIVIEKFAMVKDFPYTKKYFDFVEERVFDDKAMAAWSDDGTASSFMNYLLLRMRKGSAFTGTCQLFDDHKADMLAHCKAILGDADGTSRLNRVVAFFDYLKSLGLDMKSVPQEFSTGADVTFGPPAGMSSGVGGGGKLSGSAHHIPTSPTEDEVESTTSGSSGGGGGGGAGRGLSGAGESSRPDGYDPDEDPPPIQDDVLKSYNEQLFSGEYSHVFYDTSYFEASPEARAGVETLLSTVNAQANEIATVIKTYQSRNRLRYMTGKSSGRLHVPSAIAGKPVNVFKKKERVGLCPDLAISVLCDNSGSMHGAKSEICTQAMLALAAACQKCGVPLEINAFTEANMECQTIRIKQFKDTFEKAKPYFGIVSGVLNPYYDTEVACFNGNIDEINLYNIWLEYRKQPWNDKVMIVISDGETCGASDDLRNLVEQMIADGIYTIGIGVCDRSVEYCYPHCKVFPDEDSLKELPAYLSGVLTALIKG